MPRAFKVLKEANSKPRRRRPGLMCGANRGFTASRKAPDNTPRSKAEEVALCCFKVVVLWVNTLGEGTVFKGESGPVVSVFAGGVLVPTGATRLPHSALDLLLDFLVIGTHGAFFNING